jgi:pseudouridine synthase
VTSGTTRAGYRRENAAVRLNAYLARSGVASRRGADALITAGRITVNGAPGQLNTFVGSADDVRVDGRVVGKQALRYVLLNKPRGTITTAHDPEGRPTVVDLVGGPTRVVPVGRLDRDTTGVLLLTNDGELAHRLSHPRYRVEKVYVAEVEGEPDDAELRRLADGVELEDGVTAPARVRSLAHGRVELALHEGRNQQVRRMLEAVGHPVVRLRRSRYAGLTTGRLGRGRFRDLTREEVARLRRLVGL